MSAWRPTAQADALRLRAALNRLIRAFFHERGVLEVETPTISRAGNTDPNIESLCVGQGAQARWLRTSPEFALKRLLANMPGDYYELGRVFRAGEVGRKHNPEFTMLEWYRQGWDHRRLMDEVAELLQAALRLVGREVRVVQRTHAQLFQASLGIDPHATDIATLRAALGDVDVRAEGLDRDDWLNLLLTHRIEPALHADELLMLYDFPASQAALARIRPGVPAVAERFEAYIGSVEIANGYHELRDAEEQRARFEADCGMRERRGQRVPPIDTHLIEALRHGMPACAGVALGVDRLLMVMLGATSIDEVIAFSAARA
jgi:lysyl-tRNA synthetase class 2